ncbi:MAG TPA: hypothetical protein VN681_13640 [Stellaceae bacterium]|nr:hypothetical protein [Stellaceae bacterium]
MFHARDLPAERARWDPIFLAALGSPDPHGRQLEALRAGAGEGALRIGMPSGVLTVAADVARDAASGWVARSGSFYRTARRLFDGRVHVSLADAAGTGGTARRLTEVA